MVKLNEIIKCRGPINVVTTDYAPDYASTLLLQFGATIRVMFQSDLPVQFS